jgi:hypothetical protein
VQHGRAGVSSKNLQQRIRGWMRRLDEIPGYERRNPSASRGDALPGLQSQSSPGRSCRDDISGSRDPEFIRQLVLDPEDGGPDPAERGGGPPNLHTPIMRFGMILVAARALPRISDTDGRGREVFSRLAWIAPPCSLLREVYG